MTSSSPPSVVLFDLDDTLFDHLRAVDVAVSAQRRRLGWDPATDGDERIRWRELEELHYHRYLAGELDFIGQRRARVRDFVAPYGVTLADDEAADAWWADYAVGYRGAWSLHDDTVRALDRLADRRVGLITNGDLASQTTKVESVGLHHRVEHIIASGAVGVAKPDPRIFHHACAAFEVEPADAAYVGDRFRTDALGAAAAGLLGIWLDRRGLATEADRAEAGAARVPIIGTLDDLPPLLA